MDQSDTWPLCYETNNYSPALSELFASQDFDYPSLPEQLRGAAAAGFSLVGLDMGNVGRYLASGHDAGQLSDEIRRLKLGCLEVANLTISDDIDGVLNEARHFVEIAQAVDARFIQFSVFGDPGKAAATARTVEAIITDHDLQLALEFLPFSPIDSIESSLAFIHGAGLKKTRIILDTWHLFFGPDPWRQLDALPVEDIAYVQFNDHAQLQTDNLLFETVNHRELPGSGHFDLERFCSNLKNRGFNGAISVEVLSATLRTWTPQRFADAEYQATRRFWA